MTDCGRFAPASPILPVGAWTSHWFPICREWIASFAPWSCGPYLSPRICECVPPRVPQRPIFADVTHLAFCSGHAGYNDLVPDQHGGKILLNFSSIIIVNKWSVMYPRCTMTFHSDGLVNWLYDCDFWIGIRSGSRFISSGGGFSWRLFWQTLERSRSAGPSMLVRYRQCTSQPKT